MKILAYILSALLLMPLALCDAQILAGAMQGRSYVIYVGNAQTNPAAANWNLCALPGCNPGGTNAPASVTWTSAASPSLSGSSVKFAFTTTSTATQTNVLEYYNTNITCNNCNYYLMDMWVYPVDTSVINALEFDDAQFNVPANLEFMMGGQCVLGSPGNMNQWNQNTNSWVTGPATCSFPAGQWTHFQRLTHISGSNYCYDWVEVGGVLTTEGQCYPASTLPSGWTNQNLFQVQVDSSNASASPVVYYDLVNFQVWR